MEKNKQKNLNSNKLQKKIKETIALYNQYSKETKKLKNNVKKLNTIKDTKSYYIWQLYNRYKRGIINRVLIPKKIVNKIVFYYNLYKKNPDKFKIIKSIFETEKKSLFINKIDNNFIVSESVKKLDLIIPWYGDENILKLIPNILETDYDHISNLFVINDCYPNQELNTKLEKFINKINDKKIVYVKQDKNKGFVGTVNNGFSLIKTDCIILNSDILTTPNWLKKFLDVSESDQKIATICPLSNNATIFSVPQFLEKNIDENYTQTAQVCETVYPQKTIEVPTGHGFCMYIRKEYLDKYGVFDEKTFGAGYGEENDLCMRFAEHGLKNLALLNTYIIHLESQSFGDEKRINQIKNNYPKLLLKHPNYDNLVQQFIKDNPLKDIQELIRYFQSKPELLKKENVLVVTHTNPYKIIGGVEIETAHIIEHLNKKYQNKNVLLYFYDQQKNQLVLFILENGVVVKQIKFNKNINPENILKWILKSFKIKLTIVEHLMYHSLLYGKILNESKIKFVLFIHDFYFYCPNADLINEKGQFCQYQGKKEICEKCFLTKQNKKINMTEFRQNSSNIISKYANEVVFNSEFTRDQYIKLFKLSSNKKFKISYPE